MNTRLTKSLTSSAATLSPTLCRSLAAIGLALMTGTASAATLSGTAVSVVDGNTLVVAEGARRVSVKLKGLDAPVGREKLAAAAKAQLAHLVLRQRVRVVFAGNATSRTVTGNVFLADNPSPRTVNRELVRRGFALATERGAIRGEERKAKAQKIGIHGPSLVPFIRFPVGWQVTGNADCIPFVATATVAQRKRLLKQLEAVYAETDRLTLGRILLLSDPTLGFGGAVEIERSTQLNLARNKNFARRFREFGGNTAFAPAFNTDDTTFGTWKVQLRLNALSSTQPILRLQETSGTDVNGLPITPGVRQFSIEPDLESPGRLIINGASFASGPL